MLCIKISHSRNHQKNSKIDQCRSVWSSRYPDSLSRLHRSNTVTRFIIVYNLFISFQKSFFRIQELLNKILCGKDPIVTSYFIHQKASLFLDEIVLFQNVNCLQLEPTFRFILLNSLYGLLEVSFLLLQVLGPRLCYCQTISQGADFSLNIVNME